jgi:hypothetical protein
VEGLYRFKEISDNDFSVQGLRELFISYHDC